MREVGGDCVRVGGKGLRRLGGGVGVEGGEDGGDDADFGEGEEASGEDGGFVTSWSTERLYPVVLVMILLCVIGEERESRL